MKKHQPSVLTSLKFTDPMKDYRDTTTRITSLVNPLKDWNTQIADLTVIPNLSARMASLTTMPDLSAQMASLTAMPDLSAQMASLTAMPDLSAQIASLTAMPDLSAQIANLTAMPDLSAQIASLTAMPDLSAQMVSLTAIPDLSAQIASLTAIPDLSAQMVSLTAIPDLSAQMASLTAMPDLSAQMVSLTAMPDLSTRIAELSKMQDLSVHMATLSVVPRSMQELSVSLDFLKHSIKDACNSGITVDENGTIKLSSKELAVFELQELTVDVLQRSVEVNQSVENYINDLIHEIKKQKDPLIQRVLSWLVFPLIVGLILSVATPVSEHYVSAYLAKDKRVKVKIIKQNANNAITNPDLLNEMRFVNTPLLNVRMQPSIKSEPIGTLKFSTPIVVIERKKSWTLVEWADDEKGVSIKGWVFSRYLQKFR
ncbi:hypothetical protein VCRA2113O415_680002 [Vibrio crassostreae]|nr:hypothetical protein VCRA2113O415_680002 [Vibrio crassostreae]CAK2950032.1 hypothetical protein VCRA2113O420_640004 [Vibrio crassostreae]CAK3559338.1 hypothetical protein VCRA2121O436_620002 [Vibrio crassostreae]